MERIEVMIFLIELHVQKGYTNYSMLQNVEPPSNILLGQTSIFNIEFKRTSIVGLFSKRQRHKDCSNRQKIPPNIFNHTPLIATLTGNGNEGFPLSCTSMCKTKNA